MPDCSYFLQGALSFSFHVVFVEMRNSDIDFLAGLCNNQNCPYRHVNVNPKASTCEGFLRGYCADGNEVMFGRVTPINQCLSQLESSCYIYVLFFVRKKDSNLTFF